VPIRLEFDVDHHKMRDAFIWNLNGSSLVPPGVSFCLTHVLVDPIVTPEAFAQTIVEDYGLTANYHTVIVKAIQDQLSDYRAHSNNYDGEAGEYFSVEDHLQRGVLDDKSAAWWESWREKMRATYLSKRKNRKRRKALTKTDGSNDEDVFSSAAELSMTLEELSRASIGEHEDMRILIKVCSSPFRVFKIRARLSDID
jgi:SWI/SNF-related matrix-associated actin-dependent regulator of chromatin subfamily B member 1